MTTSMMRPSPLISLLALSIALSSASGTTPTREAAFVANIARRRRPAPSFGRASPRAATSAAGGDDGVEEEGELPPSGSFFNEVPPPREGSTDAAPPEVEPPAASGAASTSSGAGDIEMFEQILRQTKVTRGGSGGRGFSKTTPTTDHAAPSVIQTAGNGEKRSFVGIGKPLNDVRNPEYDADGYTLYVDEETGEKRRVFEALVDYPSVFKMKIVGRDDEEGSFAPGIVATVARSCGVEAGDVKHTKRRNGKWTSVTVHAPVESADMLYALYENVDKDPRVKFKF
ncbi:hypothetical protein ACHAWF_012718 [Thalassiosira exigua]